MIRRNAWRRGRRAATLAYLRASEAVLWLAGRRGAYGVLKLALRGELAEEEGEQRLLGMLRRPAEDFLGLIGMLRWAREDPQLQAVLIEIDEIGASWARLQGIRRGVERLRQAGKTVWAHVGRAGIREYYLASAAERISITPAATLDIAGLSSEATFFLGALEKAGIQADVVQMGRYKSAAEAFTRREMSAAHREMVESLVDDLYGQIVEAVAGGRGLETEAVRQTFDRGPFLAREALAARLVDEISYADEVERRLIERCHDAAVIEHGDYARRRMREMRARALRDCDGTIAVLHVNGTIKSGESIPGPDGASAAGSTTVAAALKEMREREDVKGVLVRVSSPGGSGLASDLVWHEITRTREKKPVVISCGDVAASGGYYVAIGGAPILAEPGTITGSIGVIAGKATLRGLYDWLGISKEVVYRGRHAMLYSDYVPLGSEERERVQSEAESFYRDFVEKVARARRLTLDATEAAAQGRVWTGRQAWTRGLVDELGGLEEALDALKGLIGVPRDAVMPIERFPRPRRLWKLSLDLNLPNQGRLVQLLSLLPRLRFMLSDRVWAVLPFDIRFF